MQFSPLLIAAFLGQAIAQEIHVVSVAGTNGELTFTPDNLKAAAGSMIQFQFRAGNHSVAQSNFDNPCTPISEHVANATGIFSGYQDVAASEAQGVIPTYTIMVADEKPLWFYCSRAKHCQGGMVMVVNENTAANASRSLTAFKELAAAAPANYGPGETPSTGSPGTGTGTDSGSGTPTGGETGTTTIPTDGAGTTIAPGAGNLVSVSASMGLLSLAAAFLLL